MVRRVREAEVQAFRPGEDDARVTIPQEHINRIELTERIQGWKDKVRIDIDNKGGRYSGKITAGDRIEVTATDITPHPKQTDEGTSFGESSFGEDAFTSQPAEHIVEWTGVAGVPEITEEGSVITTMRVEATGFVGEILSFRKPFINYEKRQIAGTSDSIVNDLLTRYAPLIDQKYVGNVTTQTTLTVDGDDLLETIKDLAEIGDAIMTMRDSGLAFREIEELHTSLTLEGSDYDKITVSGDDNKLANLWRVNGGTDTDLDEEQTTVDSYQQVSETQRITTPLDPEKNRLKNVSLYTRKGGSHSGIRVRIQRSNNANDGPRDPSVEKIDLERVELNHRFLTEDGWTDKGWELKGNVLSENPWLIIEGTGTDTHEVGVNTSGVPAFRTFYEYDIFVQDRDFGSINEYRLRERNINPRDVTNFERARDIAARHLRHNKFPIIEVNLGAKSPRMHRLKTGEVVQINKDKLNLSGEYIITERNIVYEGESNLVHDGLTLQDVKSV